MRKGKNFQHSISLLIVVQKSLKKFRIGVYFLCFPKIHFYPQLIFQKICFWTYNPSIVVRLALYV